MPFPCIFLIGPTASGKTDLAIYLVKHLPCEIISVDSAMVYQGMDIGTAKPDAATLKQAPHRLIDICDPAENYSVGRFYQDVHNEVKKIYQAGRIPLLVGGTMLYFNSLLKGLSNLPTANAEIRERLDKEAKKVGWAAMHQRLTKLDPETAQRIHSNDSQRIQRALEVYEISGYTITTWYAKYPQQEWTYPTIKITIAPSQREILHERIAQRFYIMLEQGLIDEVRFLFERDGLNTSLPSVRCVGYRQVWSYLTGELSKEDLPQKAIAATRQLAKRQLTWLRTQIEGQYFDSLEPDLNQKVLEYLEKFIQI